MKVKTSIEKPWKDSRILYSSLVFLILFIVYVRTSAPTITLMDGAEYAVGGWFLGIPHPPGYPIHMVLFKAAQIIPFGNIASRINIFCGLVSSFTGIFLFLLLIEMGIRKFSGTAVALLAGFSSLVWEQSATAEVYALYSLVFVVLLYLMFHPRFSGRIHYALAVSFLSGVGIAVHQMLILLLPVFLLSFILSFGKRLNLRKLMLFGLFFLLGLSPVIYMPLRASQNPVLNRGSPCTWAKMKEFSFVRAGTQVSNLQKEVVRNSAVQFLDYLKTTIEQFTIIIFILAAAGTVILLRQDGIKLMILLLLWFFQTAGISLLFYSSGESLLYMVKPFYLPSHIITAILAAMGADGIFRSRGFHTFLERRRSIPAAVLTTAFCLCVIFQAVRFWYPQDRHEEFTAYDWSRNVLNSILGDPYIVTAVDEFFPLAYLQKVERYNERGYPVHLIGIAANPENWYKIMSDAEDVLYFPIGYDTPDKMTGYEKRVRQGIDNILDKGNKRVYLAHYSRIILPEGVFPDLEGIVYHLEKPPPSGYDPCRSDRLWRLYVRRPPTRFAPGAGPAEWRMMINYNVSLNNLANWYASSNLERAEKLFRYSLFIDPANHFARERLESIKNR